MADLTSNDDYVIRIDDDGNGSGVFRVRGGSPALDLFQVLTDGNIEVWGRIEVGSSGVEFVNTAGSGDVVSFRSNPSTPKATLSSAGVLDCPGGVVIRSGSAAASGGQDGDFYFQADAGSGTFKLSCKGTGFGWLGVTLT